MNLLFDSPEIQAVVGIFRFMVSEIDSDALKALWDVAALIPAGADWTKALKVLETGRDFAAHKRHAVYNIQRVYLDFLEALELREDALPGDAFVDRPDDLWPMVLRRQGGMMAGVAHFPPDVALN